LGPLPPKGKNDSPVPKQYKEVVIPIPVEEATKTPKSKKEIEMASLPRNGTRKRSVINIKHIMEK
jgi:hypothetical protein